MLKELNFEYIDLASTDEISVYEVTPNLAMDHNYVDKLSEFINKEQLIVSLIIGIDANTIKKLIGVGIRGNETQFFNKLQEYMDNGT